MQNRTHTCDELRLSDAGKRVQLSGWMDSVRIVSANLAFVILRDFYGTTQVVIDDEEQMKIIRSLNKESVISVTGIVRERDNKNPKFPRATLKSSRRKSTCWAAAVTTSCRSRLTAPARRTRASA